MLRALGAAGAFGIGVAAWASVAQADAFFSAYECEFLTASTLESGRLVQSKFTKDYLANKIYVDHNTGEIVGKFFASSYWTGEHTLIDRGSDEQSFKVMFLSGGTYRHVMLLEVMEYAAGPQKPFLLVDDTDVFTGICTHM